MSRHQQFYPVLGDSPTIGNSVFVAPNASVIGDVTIGDNSSVWYGAVIRGDLNPVTIGQKSNIQDRAIIHVSKSSASLPTKIGDLVSIGHRAVVHSAIIEDECIVGMGAIVTDGCVVSKNSYVAPGTTNSVVSHPAFRLPSLSQEACGVHYISYQDKTRNFSLLLSCFFPHTGAHLLPNTVVKTGELWAGSPAKKIRVLTDEEIEKIITSAEDYMLVSEAHHFETTKDYDRIEFDRLKRKIMAYRTPDYQRQMKSVGMEDQQSEIQARLDLEQRKKDFGG